MKSEELESRMRELEYFHTLRLIPATWAVVRIDGRSFSRFTEKRFEKPFDPKFRDHMLSAATAVLTALRGIYAYTESDEISILLGPEWSLFDRELEKTVSLSAGIGSAAFSISCGEAAHFDSRVWLGPTKSHVIDYFRWRQADAGRCALNGWCYWTLRNAGKSVADATSQLKGLGVGGKNELLFTLGINFNELPLWQRRGIGIYWEQIEKPGFNPNTQEHVVTKRNRLKTDLELPMKDEYDGFLHSLMEQHLASGSKT